MLLGAAALYGLLGPDAQLAPSQQSFADLQVTQLTTSGNAERRRSLGREIRCLRAARWRRCSLWLRQTATTNNVRIVPTGARRGALRRHVYALMAHLSTSFVRRWSAVGDLARAVSGRHPQIVGRQRGEPHLVGTPTASASRFLRLESLPSFRRNAIVAAPMADRNASWPAREFRAVDLTGRSLATELPLRLVTRRPAHCARCRGPRGGRIVFVDSGPDRCTKSQSPAGRRADSAGSMRGRSCSTSQSSSVPPSQLIRQPYPAGPLSRLTNDPNDYVGSVWTAIAAVWSRPAGRTLDLWVGDGGRRPGRTSCSACRSASNVSRGRAIDYLRRRRGWKARNPEVTPGKTLLKTSSSRPRSAARAMAARSCSSRPPTTPWTLWTADITVAGRPGWFPR